MSAPVTRSQELGGLAGHLDGFVRAVREAGIPVGISQAVDAAEILTVIDLLDREQLRHGLAAVLLQRGPSGRRTTCCSTCGGRCPTGPRRTTTPRSPRRAPRAASRSRAAPARTTPRWPRPCATSSSGCCSRATRTRSRRFARRAVDRLGSGQPSPTGQSYFSYRVMRALSPDTLVAQLLAGLLAEGDRGGLNEQVARQTVRERVEAFKNAVETEVRRRTANEKGRERVAKNAVRPLADQIDFLRAQSTDLAELRRTVAPLARRLACGCPRGARSGARAGWTSARRSAPRSAPAASRS